MNRYRTFTMIGTFWMLLFQIGLGHPLESQKPRPGADERAQPVLQEDDDAKTIVAKAVKAYGGKKAFSRWNCGYVKYKPKGGILPAQIGEVTLEDTFQLPGHFKRITRVTANGKELVMAFVVNHGKGWKKRGNEPAEAIDNEFTKRTEHPFAGFCNLTALTEAEVRLTKLKKAKVDGKEAIGVQAQSEKLGKVDFYFSSKTGLLLKTSKFLPSADPDKPTVMDTYLGNYKEVQGGKIPMRIKGFRNDKVIVEVDLIDVKFADKFDESVFAKP